MNREISHFLDRTFHGRGVWTILVLAATAAHLLREVSGLNSLFLAILLSLMRGIALIEYNLTSIYLPVLGCSHTLDIVVSKRIYTISHILLLQRRVFI